MLRLIGIMISIGLADSINPSTVAPALFLAAHANPRRAVAQFTAGVFFVYLLGGAAIALGPGQLVLSLVPKPDLETRHVLEVVAGGVLIAVGMWLWRSRNQLGKKRLPMVDSEGRAAWLLGATIMALELPTAFPYFAAIAAIVDSGSGPVRQLIFIAIYNVAFVLPLILMIATLMIAPDRAASILHRARDVLQRRWPTLLAGLALIAGVFVATLGVTGLAGNTHGTLGRVSRRLRHLISH